MKIDIPFEIGDPVLVIEFNQHDGYYIESKCFDYRDIPQIGKTIFANRKEADTKLKELEKRQAQR